MGKCLAFSLWLARTTSPSNPASPVTWYQRERHSSAGKAIRCSPSLLSVHPAFWTLSFPNFHPSFLSFPTSPSLSFFSPHSLFEALSSTPLPSILPCKHGRIWVYGKGLGACGGLGWGLRLSPWRSTSKQSSEGGVGVCSHISSHITTVTAGGAGRGVWC